MAKWFKTLVQIQLPISPLQTQVQIPLGTQVFKVRFALAKAAAAAAAAFLLKLFVILDWLSGAQYCISQPAIWCSSNTHILSRYSCILVYHFLQHA